MWEAGFFSTSFESVLLGGFPLDAAEFNSLKGKYWLKREVEMSPVVVSAIFVSLGVFASFWVGANDQDADSENGLKTELYDSLLLINSLKKKLEDAENELRQLRAWRRRGRSFLSSMDKRLLNLEQIATLRHRDFRVWRERYFPGRHITAQEEAEGILICSILRARLDLDELEDDDSWPGNKD